MFASGRGLTCDWLGAGLALLGVQAAEALEAVRAVVPRREVLTSQLDFTVGAHKALPVPRLVPIGHAPLGQSLRGRRVKGQFVTEGLAQLRENQLLLWFFQMNCC